MRCLLVLTAKLINPDQDLVTIRRAAITPGIHPQQVRIKTSKTEPQPLSMTASGGNMMQRMTLQSDMLLIYTLDANREKRFHFVGAVEEKFSERISL